MYIYKTTNILNNKIYIGQSSKDINVKYFGSGLVLLKAIKKYGENNFIKEILEYNDNKDYINEREIYWISFYDSTNRNVGLTNC